MFEPEFLKIFSAALHDIPQDDAELVLYLDAYRMYLLGLVSHPDSVYRDMRATFRRAKEIKAKVVETKRVDLERLVRYFQNDLPALRMALPRGPRRSRSGRSKRDARPPVDLLDERRAMGKTLRRSLLKTRRLLGNLADGSVAGDDAARELERTVFGRSKTPGLAESLSKLQSGKKAWEVALSRLGFEDEPPAPAGGGCILDDQAPSYPVQIFALRLAENLRAGKRTPVVARCRGTECERSFVKASARDSYCSERCQRRRKSRRRR
jgi:hypothetical protein